MSRTTLLIIRSCLGFPTLLIPGPLLSPFSGLLLLFLFALVETIICSLPLWIQQNLQRTMDQLEEHACVGILVCKPKAKKGSVRSRAVGHRTSPHLGERKAPTFDKLS